MTVLEQFSLFQRMVGSIKADVEEGKTVKALGKLEILEGELATLRKDYEEPENVEEPAPAVSNDLSFMNDPVDGEYTEIIDNLETEVIN